jgi:hypothetical protein
MQGQKMNMMTSAFDQRESLEASIARLYRAEAIYYQQRAADNSALAAFALVSRAFPEASAFQRAAAYFAAEAWRCLSRLLEG